MKERLIIVFLDRAYVVALEQWFDEIENQNANEFLSK